MNRRMLVAGRPGLEAKQARPVVKVTLGERPVLLWDVPERRTGSGPITTTGAPVRGKIAMGRTIRF